MTEIERLQKEIDDLKNRINAIELNLPVNLMGRMYIPEKLVPSINTIYSDLDTSS